jgi:hypothetical protein
MKRSLILMSLAFLFGCSQSPDQPSTAAIQNQSPSVDIAEDGVYEPTVPAAIYISLYSTNHPDQSQPMLIDVVSNTDVILEYVSKLQMREAGVLPMEQVTEVYYLQVEYEKNGVSEYKDFLYAKTSGNLTFYKEFKMGAEFGYDHYDKKSKHILLDSIGANDWYVLTDPLPL